MPPRLVSRDGKSAYQTWLDAGNTGTEAQFITSLRGPTGATGNTGPAGGVGPVGPAGPAGSNATAYVLPRYTGGTIGRIVKETTVAGSPAWADVLPGDQDLGTVGYLASDNQVYGQGGHAPLATTTPLLANTTYRVATPSGSGPNLTAYATSDDALISDTFTLTIGGTVNGNKTRLLLPAQFLPLYVPATVTYKYFDATEPTLGQNAVGNGMTYRFASSGQAQFSQTKRADSDSAGGTGFMASPIVESGAGVSLQHKSFGGLHILTPTTWDAQADGQWVYQFQVGNGSGGGTGDITQPGFALRMTGGLSTAGRALIVRLQSGKILLQDVTLNADNTFSATTVGTSVTVGWSVNAIYQLRVDARGTDIKARLWALGSTEPSTWTLTAAAPYTTAGLAGPVMTQDWHRMYRIGRAIGTGGTAPLVRP